LIEDETIFDIELNRTDYILKITKVKLIKIVNLLSLEAKSTLKVKFSYDNINYENKLMTEPEKRKDKISKIFKKMK